MDKVIKMGKIEAIFFLMVIMVNKIVLNTPKVLLKSLSSGSWINIIYLTIIMVVLILVINHFYKKFHGQDILDISKFLGGKTLMTIVGIAYVLGFLFIVSNTLRLFSVSMKLIYFNNSPLLYIILFFIVR